MVGFEDTPPRTKIDLSAGFPWKTPTGRLTSVKHQRFLASRRRRGDGFVIYGAYLHAFFRWSAPVEAIHAMARLAMHERARNITFSET